MEDAIHHFSGKLAHETDPFDLHDKLQGNEKIVVIDARSREAYDEEHIPGAVSFPHREMTDESTSGFSKNDLYVTYCDGIGCNASTKGALNMSKLGFKVKEMIGGSAMVIQWRDLKSQMIPFKIVQIMIS